MSISDGSWSKKKPTRDNQLFFKDLRKLRENDELLAFVEGNNPHDFYTLDENEEVDARLEGVKPEPLQFIKLKILDTYWHLIARNMEGAIITLDLGTYGAVCWRNKYHQKKWLTLKE